jgi:hypothetical protein
MSVSLNELPTRSAAVWARLRDELLAILDDNLIALWAYGARTFPDPPLSLGDHDSFAILQQTPPDADIHRVSEAQKNIERELGVNLDTSFILAVDASRPDFPPPAWGEGREVNWAFHRAHWLAGRFVLLHGRPPEDIVPAPNWSELKVALREELDHLERHVTAGDNDPYEASYAMLNGSRILHSIETRNVVLSKRAAGEWALENLPARWHEAIHAAGRAYDGEASSNDVEVLKAAMAPFVAMVGARWKDDGPK